MREIKFKAFIKTTKEMINIIGFIKENSQYRIWWLSKETDLIINVSYHESMVEILQYTGLNDKNGKEIYEGDVYSYINNDGNDRISFIDNIEELYFDDWVGCKLKRCEVIGNVYQNLELLKS